DRACTSAADFLRRADELSRLAPVWEVKLSGSWAVDTLAAAPALGRLTALNLYANALGLGRFHRFLLASAHLGRLRRLDARPTPLNPVDAAALAAAPGLSGLRELVLDGNPVGDEGLAALAASPWLGRLRLLHLGGRNLVGPAGVRELAESPLAAG